MLDINCPTCGQRMKKTKHDTHICVNKDCTERFILIPLSIFGVTEKK
jgi:hypothetical protein